MTPEKMYKKLVQATVLVTLATTFPATAMELPMKPLENVERVVERTDDDFTKPTESIGNIIKDGYKISGEPNTEATLETLREHCSLPEKIHPVSLEYLKLYIEGEMLTTAFVRGFTSVRSDLLSYVGCIARYFNYPLDPFWEPNFDPNAHYLNFKPSATDNPNLLPQ